MIAPHWINTPLIQKHLEEMAAAGLTPEKGMTISSIDHVVNATTKCATDDNVHGRSFIVVQEGYFDMNDDEAGGWAGDYMKDQWRFRRSKGDLML